MRRKRRLSRYLLGWKLLPNPGNTAENIGVLFPITNPQFLHKTFAFGELFEAEFPNWESPPGEPINILWGIFLANPGGNKYPVRNHPCTAWSGWVPVEGSRSCPSPAWGTLGCVTVIYQGWARSRCLCSPDRAKPQSHTCFWESQTPVSSEVTRNHHIISCATAENVGSSLKLTMSEWIKSSFSFWGSFALLSCQHWHLSGVLLRS